MNDELKAAWECYYRLDFAAIDPLLKGRSDAEALLLKGIVAQARGDTKEMGTYFKKILMHDPHYHLTRRDYPPQVVNYFEAMERPGGIHTGDRLFLAGYDFPIDQSDLWRERFKKIKEQGGWDELLLLAIEPVGWNHKLSLLRPDSQLKKMVAVEIKGEGELNRAAKILVQKGYFVDTSSNIQ